MYSFISPAGQTIKCPTIRAFSNTFEFNYRSARALATGYRARINGWCSTSPKTKRARQRFTTRLVNTRTGQIEIVGQSVKGLAERHGLSYNDLVMLINGRTIMYRDWCLANTLELAQAYC